MAGLRNREALDALRARIAGLENRPAFAEAASLGSRPEDLFAAPPGLLHEVFTPERRNAGSSLGFALGQARGLLSEKRPALIILQLVNDASDIGLPYGAGLTHFGIDPDAVVIGRIKTIPELLWALEEAVSCHAVAAVIADVSGPPKALDFTASRRLSMRAAASRTSIFFLRYGRDRESSAAQLRWRLTPAISRETVFDARQPAGPRCHLTLEKGRLGAAHTASAGFGFTLDWTRDGFVVVDNSREGGEERIALAAAPGAAPAALGDRLSKAG